MLPYNVRLELARKSFAGMENLVVSDFEEHLPKPSYSVNLFRELRKDGGGFVMRPLHKDLFNTTKELAKQVSMNHYIKQRETFKD